VRLEPLADEHLPLLDALIADPVSLRFTRIPEPTPPGFARLWLDSYEAGRADGTREAFAAVDDDGSFLGLALAPEIERDAREAELGYVVTPEARGRGVATAMLRALTDWAFTQGILRATLIISVDNAASERVAANCGYVREGVMRSIFFKDGRRNDAALWSRLPSDPDVFDDERGGAVRV
jgi:RimJ/RimL family protein N-acetyltransferase